MSMNAAYTDLLQGNLIGMHATAMYWRKRLEEIGGFDMGLRRCEDYAVFLRMAQVYSIASHPGIVAEYRIHDRNMSTDLGEMLRWVVKVHGRQKHFAFSHPGGQKLGAEDDLSGENMTATKLYPLQ